MSQVPLIRAVDARSGTASGDGDVDARVVLAEGLGPGLAEVDHGVRALDLDGLGLGGRGGAAGRQGQDQGRPPR